MKKSILLFCFLILGQTFMYSQQAERVKGPVIQDYGATYEVPHPDLVTDIDSEFKVIFDVDKSSEDKSEVNRYIEVAARFLNMHVRAGMKPEQLKVAMTIHAGAAQDVLNNEVYKAKYGVVNPNFKLINDTFGHATGDDLLKHIASLLVDMSRESDVATRFAGDEFVLICPETSANSTETMLMRLKGYIKDHPLVMESNKIPFSISYGIASTEDETILDPYALLKKADEALYWMKNARQYQYFGVS